MHRKILTISIINVISNAFNFLSTILIVKIFGLSILGEFTTFNSIIALLLLLYVILPPNYSIFQLQDDKFYIKYLNFNIIFISLLVIPIAYFFGWNNWFNLNGLILFFYVTCLALLNYFDMIFQATNQISKYFLALFLISSIRLMAFLYLFLMGGFHPNFNLLIGIYIFPVSLILFLLIYSHKKFFLEGTVNNCQFNKYIKTNFPILRTYYFETVVKRLKDNLPVLVFSTIVSTETIGLYSLIIRVGSVVLGQIRIFESFLMNRSNLSLTNSLKKAPLILGLFIQVILIGVGLPYVQINTGQFHFSNLLIYSFIAYPYLQIIILRTRLFSRYETAIINKAYLSYILLIILSLMIASILDIDSLNYMLITILGGNFLIGFILKKESDAIS